MWVPSSIAELEPHTLELLIPGNVVSTRVEQIGIVTSRDYWKKNPLLIAIKNGGVQFDEGVSAAAQGDELVFDRGTIGISSYGNNTKSNGRPRVTEPFNVDVRGRDVVYNEDISDFGYTNVLALQHALACGAKSAAMNVLLWKPSRQVVDVSLYQVGFEIPDRFVVGEGIDWQQFYRELTGIWTVNIINIVAATN